MYGVCKSVRPCRASITFLILTSLRPIMDFYNFKRMVLASSDSSRSRACLPTIILPPVVHQSKSLSDKRSTPAGGRDLSSSEPNPLGAHAAIRVDDRCALPRCKNQYRVFTHPADSGLSALRRWFPDERDFREGPTARMSNISLNIILTKSNKIAAG